jgi:Flp pilus assembly protein TadD
MRQKQFDEAETSLRKAVDIHPGDYSAYNKLGTFLYRSGRFVEAIEQYQYVVALKPDDMNGHSNLGSAYMLTGHFAAAAAAYERAISIKPTKLAYSNLGLMHYYLRDLDRAIEDHRKAVELQPKDHLARSNLGDALWIAGREDDARREFERAEHLALGALRLNPNDPNLMMDLAWISAILDKPDVARELMDKVRSLAPNDPYTYYYDALVLLRANDQDAALAALETAVDKGYSRILIGAEPHLTALKTNERFAALIHGG